MILVKSCFISQVLGDVMNISIFGVGAIGCVLASSFAQLSDVSIHLHVRGQWGAQLMLQGLKVKGSAEEHISPDRFDFSFQEKPIPEDLLMSSDVIFITSKAYAVEPLLSSVQQVLKSDGAVCILSNGLGLIEIARKYLPAESLIHSTITHGAYRDQDTVYWAGKGGIQIGLTDGFEHPKHHQIVELLNRADLNPEVKDDGKKMMWEKALLNIAINPIAALTGKKNGELIEQSLLENCLSLFEEAALVAKYDGIELPSPIEFEQHLLHVLNVTGENKCSMLQDLEFGRLTEIDFLNGKVVTIGEYHGIATPLNAMVTSLIRSIHPPNLR